MVAMGALCQYTIEYVEGVYTPQLTEELDPAMTQAIPDVVCQGYDDFQVVTGPPIGFAHGYYWVLEWSGDTVTTTNPELIMDIPDDAPPGTWEICIRAFSGCDTTDTEVCVEVEIVEIDDVDKEPESFCPEDFGFNWHGQTISGPGVYNATFDNPDGCPYDSIWQVEEYPEVPVGQIDTLYCMNENFDPFIYEGEAYDNSGTYELLYPGMGLNGCDSTAELNLTLVGLDAFIELECKDGEFELTVLVQEVIPLNAQLSFEWYDGGATPIFDNNPLLVLDGGCYTVFVKVETAEGFCIYELEPFCFDAEDIRPDPPVLNHGDTLLCAQGGIFFCVEDPDPALTYEWSSPPGVEIYDDVLGCIEMDFSFTTGGEVCVYATDECGDGEPTCFIVDIIPTPVATISHVLDLCKDTVATVTFTGTAGPNAEFVWDFDSPTTLTGSGPGPYDVSWNLPGPKVINLMVIEPGCDTATTSGIITVTNLLPPTVNCSSTIDSVNFEWNDVVGASGYIVNTGSGPISITDSNYGLGGLLPGTVVNLTLTVVSAGPCDDIIVMSQCTAEDCPAPTIELSGPDSLCLNAPVVVTLDAVVNGSPGTGVWSGNGIIDGVAGTFDPTVSGSGQHQLTYTVDVNGCPFLDSYVVNVFDSITADFTLDPAICISDVANLNYTGNASNGASYDFDFGPATVVSGTGMGPYQLRYATPGLKTVSLQITENGCISDIVNENVTVSSELVAPVVSCMSNTSGVNFSWPDNNPAGYGVNILSGHVGVNVGPTEIDFSGLTPGEIVEVEITTISSGPCPSRIDTFSCEARECPMPVIEITPVMDICLYPGTAIVDLEVTVTNGNGVGDWSGPGIIDPVNGRFDPNIAGAGSHLITFHYLDDGCDFNFSITINVYDPPVAFISNSNLILTCTSGNSLVLDGSGSTGTNLVYLWTTTNGVFNSGENTNRADVGSEGTYQLKVTDPISGCTDSTEVVVSKDANAPDADAGVDKVITCDSLTFTLGGNSSVGGTISYLWTTPDGNIIGAGDGLTIDVDQTGTYTLSVSDASNGCEDVDVAVVTIDTAVTSIALTPGDTIDCNTSLSGVSALLGASVDEYDLQWSTTDGRISGSSTLPDVEVLQGGTYTLTIKNRDNGCSKSASASVAESDEIIDDVDVSFTNVICNGDQNGSLTINSVTGGTPPYTYMWSIVTPDPEDISNLGPGQYTLTVSDQNGCTFLQSITITEPPKVTADAGPNATVAAGDSVTINLTTNLSTNAINSIDWSGVEGVNCPGCPQLQFVAMSSETVVVMVTDTAGCFAIDSMKLTVIVPRIIFVPTVFSPDDNGINDYFYISGRFNLINIAYMQIYDRWGNQLFDAANVTPGDEQGGWDGKFNGEYVMPGVYVYSAKLVYEDGIEEVIKGDITVVR